MALLEREAEFAALSTRAAQAVAGQGGLVLVLGEAGAGKTSFVEAFLADRPGEVRVLWGTCDPLTTPRPLGPIYDLSRGLGEHTRAVLDDAEHPYEMFDAVFADLQSAPSTLVVDDLHWADQGTVDLLRFVLRRVRRSPSLVILTARHDEIGVDGPVRQLLGDIARSPVATSITLPPLTLWAVTTLVGERAIDPGWLHRLTGGNAFFVAEMLDHPGDALPTTVRNAVLARTAGLDEDAWDLLNLLACAPEAIPDFLLADLGITVPPLRKLHEANLITRSSRGVAFRHDLCRIAIEAVIPPGAGPQLHRRMIGAYDAVGRTDPAVITHHAIGARDPDRIRLAAIDAGTAAARAGAHRQAADFYRIAMESGAVLSAADEASLLELVAEQCYLIDQLDDAIDACRRALLLRQQAGVVADLSANHRAMAVYEWYNANRDAADHHVAQAVSVFGSAAQVEGASELAALGHGFAMQAFLALQASDLTRARSLVRRAVEIAAAAAEPALTVRVGIISGTCSVMSGESTGREAILAIMRSAPEHLDEIYSSGYSNLTYLDVEQRRLAQAADLLDLSLRLTVERDLPVCRVWQLGSRARLHMLTGNWDDAVADAGQVLDERGAQLARPWPLLVRGLVALRRTAGGADDIGEAWRLARRYGESLRTFPAAAAIAERAWLTGTPDDRLDDCRRLLGGPELPGLQWARGELAMWLHRCGVATEVGDVAEPYRRYLDGDAAAAAEEFERLGVQYEAALALIETTATGPVRRGLDMLDRLGAAAVADKVRLDLRAAGVTAVPARRRTSSLSNPVGLTSRQIEVLHLMDDGLTNAELAARLYLSAKTVDHHVSAILAKLNVPNRREAVRRGRTLGIIAAEAPSATT